MAKSPVSEEELQLRKKARRRLIGAIALVLLAAVFLPMILEHEPKPTGDNIDVQIPSPDNAAPLTVQAPPADTASTPQVVTTQSLSDASEVASAPVAVKPASKPKEETKKTETKSTVKPAEKKPAEKTATKPASNATAESGAFVVQVAALSDATKAQKMRDQIKAAGITVYTETVATASGKVTRVRAGPYKTRADAEKAQTKLKGIGLSGNVVPK